MNPIKQARNRVGVSRTQLAVASGVSYGEVFKAETGRTRVLNSNLARFLREQHLLDRPENEYLKWRESEKRKVLSQLDEQITR